VEGKFCELRLNGVFGSSASVGVGRQAAVAVSGDALAFLALAAVLVWRFLKTGGPEMLKEM
jgi:hypothetical protein